MFEVINLRTGFNRRTELWLEPELFGLAQVPGLDAMSGPEQFNAYAEHIARTQPERWKDNAVPLYWAIRGDEGIAAAAPSEKWLADFTIGKNLSSFTTENFLTMYRWPRNPENRVPLDWYRLPVRWRREEFGKAVGVDPMPLQPTFPLRTVWSSRRYN